MRAASYRVVALLLAVVMAAGCDWVIQADVTPNGEDPVGRSFWPKLSGDGRYVVFTSEVSDLVRGDNDEDYDVFARDLRSGSTTLVTEASDQGFAASISFDGRYVAYESWNGSTWVIRRRDLHTGSIATVTSDTGGGVPNDSSTSPSISADGRYVAFQSSATDLVPNDRNSSSDIFVRDLQSSTTTRFSVDSAGSDASGASHGPSISATGRYVAFGSPAQDIVPGITAGTYNTFRRDLQTSTTSWIGPSSGGSSISADGSRVAVSDGTEVFVRDVGTGVMLRVSADADGGDPNGASYDPSISDDGLKVAFTSVASDLVAGDNNGHVDVFVRDLSVGLTSRMGVGAFSALSGDGNYVSFVSFKGDFPGNPPELDVAVRAVGRPSIDSVVPNQIRRSTTATMTIRGSGFRPGVTIAPNFAKVGLVVDRVIVVSETELQVTMTAAASADIGLRTLLVRNSGSGPGLGAANVGGCATCLVVT